MADRATPITVRIPPRGYLELEQVAANAAKLSKVLQACTSLPLNATFSEMRNEISKAASVSPESAGLIYSGLASLRAMMFRMEASAQEILDAVTNETSLSAPEQWKKENGDRWRTAVSQIGSVLESITPDHPLLMRQKALELTYAHQNIFKEGRIITDLRPVFNTPGDKMSAMVLTHVLSIEYSDGVRRQHTEFALDEIDIRELKLAIERAEAKTRVVKANLQGVCPVIVAGDTSGA